jgi:hypothetical protein
MRLVDAELIVEEFWKPEYRTQTRRDFIAVIDKSPAIDAVPVVRCRECKYSSLPSGFTQRYGEPGTLSCHFGPCNRRNVNENDFCSYGQRKEDGHDKYPSDPV